MEAAKHRGCRDIAHWTKSIINHLYWCAISTPVGQGEVIVAKWKSLLNHICNIHHGHDDQLFPQCDHGALRGNDARKPWIRPRKWKIPQITKIFPSHIQLLKYQPICKHFQNTIINLLRLAYSTITRSIGCRRPGNLCHINILAYLFQ